MIAYDSNVVIYALQNATPWTAAARAVIKQGEFDGAVVSVLLWQEVFVGVPVGDETMESNIKGALEGLKSIIFVAVSIEICKRAVILQKQYGNRLRGYDAIHIATAIEHKAECFVTNDQELLKLGLKEIEIRALQSAKM